MRITNYTEEEKKELLGMANSRSWEAYLLKEYEEARKKKDWHGMKLAAHHLQSLGYDADYIPGYDDGEQPQE